MNSTTTTIDPDVTSGALISSDKVEGTKVYNTAGETLGSIDALMIDKQSGKVQYAVLEFGGFLGMNTDRYPLPWNLLKYDTNQDGYVVPMDKARLKDAPRYPQNAVPPYTSDYAGSVDRYYGL
jgi:sporulation protein YlmC with PRC-barrel domain